MMAIIFFLATGLGDSQALYRYSIPYNCLVASVAFTRAEAPKVDLLPFMA
jgi:hypothetical protein